MWFSISIFILIFLMGCNSANSSDEQTLRLGLKYVVYKNSIGSPVLSQKAAIQNINTINRLWSQCKIAFQLDKYLAIDIEQYSLKLNTATFAELDAIRKSFDDQKHILIVTTDRWDRSGSIGKTGANAWTTMPGEELAGVVIESPVGSFGNIVAHELGHYLDLNHSTTATNVMNPIIYDRSTQLTPSQCNAARSAIQTYWLNMIR
jgi:hypothetical protein